MAEVVADVTTGDSKLMAIDPGKRRIGVAMTDSAGLLAFPWGTIECSKDRDADLLRVAELATEEAVTTVVVGLPLSLDGSLGPAARSARSDASALSRHLSDTEIRVVSFDERFTTVSAMAALATGGKRGRAARIAVDAASATVLLEAWMRGR